MVRSYETRFLRVQIKEAGRLTNHWTSPHEYGNVAGFVPVLAWMCRNMPICWTTLSNKVGFFAVYETPRVFTLNSWTSS